MEAEKKTVNHVTGMKAQGQKEDKKRRPTLTHTQEEGFTSPSSNTENATCCVQYVHFKDLSSPPFLLELPLRTVNSVAVDDDCVVAALGDPDAQGDAGAGVVALLLVAALGVVAPAVVGGVSAVAGGGGHEGGSWTIPHVQTESPFPRPSPSASSARSGPASRTSR